MPLEAVTDSSFRYATLRFLVDADRDITIPVGVMLWNASKNWWALRIPRTEETIHGVSMTQARPYLEAAQHKLSTWIERGKLPLSPEPLDRLSDEWWTHAQKLLKHSIRVGPIQSVDVNEPQSELDTLFDAVIKPEVNERARARRVDGAVTRALGELAPYFRRTEIRGFGGRPVRGLRHASDGRTIVVVDAVNLAAATADYDVDALRGRARRITAGNEMRNVKMLVGYLASSGGLNGERPLKDFLESELGVHLYDLDRERSGFWEQANAEFQSLNQELVLQDSRSAH